jgi:hypothetical protein
MEPLSLALGVAGVAGLFSTCIECFDIVVAGKGFSEDYERLCALVSLSSSWELRPRVLLTSGFIAEGC